MRSAIAAAKQKASHIAKTSMRSLGLIKGMSATGFLMSDDSFGRHQNLSLANSIVTRRSVFGTALDSVASIHMNQTWQVNDGFQYLVQACLHSAPNVCDAR
jgi:hypothetical protein